MPAKEDELLRAEPESGTCRVICYRPRHDLTMARMDHPVIERVIETWRQEYSTLGSTDHINHAQIFESRGLMMGCSNPHPHGQVWANSTIPTIPANEARLQKAYMQKHDNCMLCTRICSESLKRTDKFSFRTLPLLPWYRSGRQLLNLTVKPDAIFAVNDPVALGVFLYIQDYGIAIPNEIALVGFSNNPNTELVRPRLTTVKQPAFEIGQTAAGLLLQTFKDAPEQFENQTITLKTELIIRESS